MMDQEKDRGFKVTDKRSAFQEESASAPKEEASQTTEPGPSEEPQRNQENQTGQSSAPPLPEANLLTLIFSLYTHVQISLGLVPDPMTQQVHKDLAQAKYNIDLLGVLKEKTQGNLTQEEEQALEQMLYEIRMTYIEVSK